MADEAGFWSQRDAAQEYTRLARTCESLFVALGALAPSLGPPAAAAAAAQLARRLGAHASAWAELVPESVLLEDARRAAPAAAIVEPSIATVVDALTELRSAVADLLTRTTEVADGAARRQARSTAADLDDALALVRLATVATTG
jgi:hypothetical protein